MPKLLFRFLLALAVAALASASHAQEAETLDDYELMKAARFDLEQTSGTVARFRMALAPREGAPIPSPVRLPLYVAGRKGAPPEVKIENANWTIYSKAGAKLGTAASGETTEWGTLSDNTLALRTAYVDEFRLVPLYRLELNISANTGDPRQPAGQAVAVLTSATVTVDVMPGPAGQDLSAVDPYFAELEKYILLNPSQASMVATPMPRIANYDAVEKWNALLAQSAAEGPIYFAKLPRGGFYSLSQEDFMRAGLSAANIPLERTSFFIGDREIPVIVQQPQGDRLLGNARVLFHCPGDPDDKLTYRPLWILTRPAGTPVLRASLERMQLAKDAATPPNATLDVTIFEPKSYHHELSREAPQLRWITSDIDPGTFRSFPFQVDGLRPGEPAKLSVWTSLFANGGTHPFDVLVNGQAVARDFVRGTTAIKIDIDVPAGVLRNGTNELAVNYPMPVVEKGVPAKMAFYQAKLSIPIVSTGIAANAETAIAATPGEIVPFQAKPLPAGTAAFAADVTKPFEPVFYLLSPMALDTGKVIGAAMKFSTPAPRVVWSYPETAFRPIELQKRDAPRSFRERAQADYLAIAHEPYLPSLQPLLEQRKRAGTVDILSVQDIYGAFSFGYLKYEAVRDAIQHAFGAREGRRIARVLLAGEGCEYWWEYRRPAQDVSPNQLPIFGWQNPRIRIRGDDGYALICGDGPIADLEIGRISAADSAQLDAAVRKILKYETAPPAGEWFNRHVFVTDDEPEFSRVAKDVWRKTFKGSNTGALLRLQDFPYEDYFRGFLRKRSVVMTDRILEQFQRGARTMVYLGHGGPNLWSSERILHIRDMETIEDGGRHPVLISGSCDTGWVDYPMDPVKTSLAEAMIRNEKGGPVAAFIPIDGTSSYEHDYLITGFYQALFDWNVREVGKLTMLSKLDYLRHRTNITVTNQFLLMGDPGTALPPLGETAKIDIRPEKFVNLTGGKLAFRVQTGESLPWGFARVQFVDARYNILAETGVRVLGGEAVGELAIPDFLEAGPYAIVANAFNAAERRQSVGHRAIAVEPMRFDVEWKTNPPVDQATAAATRVDVELAITNRSGIDLKGVQLSIADRSSTATMALSRVDFPPDGTVRRAFAVEAPAGLRFVDAKLYLATDNIAANPRPLGEGTLRLQARADADAYIAIEPKGIDVERRASPPGTLFRIPVFNMTPQALEGFAVQLAFRNKPDEAPITDQTDLPKLPVDGTATVELRSSRRFGKGTESLTLQLWDKMRTPPRIVQVNHFEYTFGAGPDLEIRAEDIVMENEFPVAGTTLFLRVPLKNAGEEDLHDVYAEPYLDAPWIADKIARSVVPGAAPEKIAVLRPGESKTVRIRWDPWGYQRDGNLFIAATCRERDREANLENNVANKKVAFVVPPNLAIVAPQSRASHTVVRPWETVSFSIPVVNDSEENFYRTFRVGGYSIALDGSKQRRFLRTFEGLDSGDGATLQFDWTVAPGENRFEINLNEDREYMESTTADNLQTFEFDYIVADSEFAARDRFWDFNELPEFGRFRSAVRTPAGLVRTAERPGETPRLLQMEPQFLVKGAVGRSFDIDNQWGMQNTDLLLAFEESAGPVRLRWELPPEDGTTVYDLYISHIGDRTPDRMSGHFKYRFENEKPWRSMEGGKPGEVFVGRIQSHDDILEAEFDSPGYPAENNIGHIRAVPAMGIYESPIVAAPAMPSGRFFATFDAPGSSAAGFDVRYGRGKPAAIEWTPWQNVSANELMPAAPANAEYVQWRARLYEAVDGSPALVGVGIEMRNRALSEDPKIVAKVSKK